MQEAEGPQGIRMLDSREEVEVQMEALLLPLAALEEQGVLAAAAAAADQTRGPRFNLVFREVKVVSEEEVEEEEMPRI
jgi:hypothetical protein